MRTALKYAALAAAGSAGLALAQDTLTPAERDLQPRPAEMARLAPHSLLLGIAQVGDRVVAVGDRGTILLSDNGENWEQSPVPVHATLTAVAFADEAHGWAVGHDESILHTQDGGKTWTLQRFNPQENKPILSVLALDAQRAYAVGAYGLFLTTRDGGASWNPLNAPAILEEGLHLNSLIRLNNGDLFIVGEVGLVAASKDGLAWTRLTVPYEGSLFGALPRGEKGALVFGMRGNVLISKDVYSNQWTAVDTGTVRSFFGGVLLPNNEVVLVGADGAILMIGADGKARSLDGNGSLGSGSLSGVLPWKNRLLVVGEEGASVIPTSWD